MKLYLKWLAEKNMSHWYNLLWDVHTSHQHKDVIQAATANCINLAYVPAGQRYLTGCSRVRAYEVGHQRSKLVFRTGKRLTQFQ